MNRPTNSTDYYGATPSETFEYMSENAQLYSYDTIEEAAAKPTFGDSISSFVRNNKILAALICVAFAVLVGLSVYVGWIVLHGASVYDLAKIDSTDNNLHQIEASYLEQGYVKTDRLGSLLDSVEDSVKKDSNVKTYERYGDSITMELNDGTLYIYTAPVLDIAGSDNDCGFVVFSQDQNPGSYVLCSTGGSDDITILADITYNIMQTNPAYTVGDKGYYWNDDLTINAFRSIGNNEIVVYVGYCGYSVNYGPFLLTGMKATDSLRQMYLSDLRAKRIGISNNGCFVIFPSFFDFYYKPGSIDGTDFIFLCGNTLHDNRLGSVLTSRGANTITGFTAYTGADYCRHMVRSYLGLDDGMGLFGTGQDGQALSFWEAVSNARAKYGNHDESTMEWMNWIGEQPSELKVYPEEGAKRQSISNTPSDNLQQNIDDTNDNPSSNNGIGANRPESSGDIQASDPAETLPNPDNNDNNGGSSADDEQDEGGLVPVVSVPVCPTPGITSPYDEILAEFDQARQSFITTGETNSAEFDRNAFLDFDACGAWGYTTIDINGDDILELLISADCDSASPELNWVYTLVGETPTKVIEAAYRYHVILSPDHRYIKAIASGGAWTGEIIKYDIVNGALSEVERLEWDGPDDYGMIYGAHYANGTLVDEQTCSTCEGMPLQNVFDEMNANANDLTWERF